MFDLVTRHINDYLAQSGLTGIRADRAVCLDVTNRMIDGYCYLFFGEDGASPRLVMKVARTEEGKRVFEIEHRNLERLQSIGMNSKRVTTPEPLGRWEDGDALLTLQSALPGTLLKNLPGRELFSEQRIDASLGLVLDWWRELQSRFGVERRVLDDALYEQVVLDPMQRYQRRYLIEDDEKRFLEQRFVDGRTLHGVELPFMARHGDFVTANMMFHEGAVGVFDWEFPLDHEPPLFDIFFFFSSLRFPYRGYRGESSHFESFAAVFWGDNYVNRAIRRRLRSIADEFEIPVAALPDLFLLALIQVANMKFEGLAVSHGHELEAAAQTGRSETDKRALWAAFNEPNKNAPFARLLRGGFENLRYVTANGLPELDR